MDSHTHFRLLGTELREFLSVTKKEISDFNALSNDLDDNQFTRRMRVRVVFSSIEAHISHMKSSALAFSISDEGRFTAEERLELQDQRRKSNGQVVDNRPALGDNIKIAFRAFARAIGSNYVVDYGNDKARRFFQATEIRNRITHPKSARDWNISDSDVQLINEAWVWFGQHLVNVSNVE